MGLGQSLPSESEESHLDDGDDNIDETNTLYEKSMRSNAPRRQGKNAHVKNDHIQTPAAHEEIVLKFQKLQMDNIIEERNHSERIIREKEKLLKEKEETIRQQANLIKTQNELLGRRKQLRSIPSVGSVRGYYDKPRTSKPIAKSTQFMRSVTSLENIHSNGQDHRNRTIDDNDYNKNYFSNRLDTTEPNLLSRQEQSNQKFSLVHPPIDKFAYEIPSQSTSRNSSSGITFQSTCYTPNNVPSTNPNGLVSKPAPSMQARRSQNNEYRRNNIRNEEPRDFDSKQSTNQLLRELEKQTNYEVQRLDLADKQLNRENPVQRTVKSSGCRVVRKFRTTSVGVPQNCKKCGSGSMNRTCKSEDESENMCTADSEIISDVD